jgi:ketosteroid isomerase-like protein
MGVDRFRTPATRPGSGRASAGYPPGMAPPGRMQLVRRGFEVYNESGPSAFLDYLVAAELMHPDFLFFIQEDLPNGGEWRGVDGFGRMAASWLEAWEEFEVQPRDVAEVSEDRILVTVRQRAVARGSGLEIDGEFFYVFAFGDGRLEQIRLYRDRGAAELAAGGTG